MLFTLLNQPDPTASWQLGILTILLIGLVGILTILLLMISWRRSVRRTRLAERRAHDGPHPDAWASAADRLPSDRPDMPPPGPDDTLTDADEPTEPWDEPDTDYGADLPYRAHFDSNEDEPDEPFDDEPDAADDLDDNLDDNSDDDLDDSQDIQPDGSDDPTNGENDDPDDSDADEDDRGPGKGPSG